MEAVERGTEENRKEAEKNRQDRQSIRLKREKETGRYGDTKSQEKKQKSEMEDMKEIQFFWDWGYLCVIFLFTLFRMEHFNRDVLQLIMKYLHR